MKYLLTLSNKETINYKIANQLNKDSMKIDFTLDELTNLLSSLLFSEKQNSIHEIIILYIQVIYQNINQAYFVIE